MKVGKKLLSVLLAIIMIMSSMRVCFGTFSFTAAAEEETEAAEEESTLEEDIEEVVSQQIVEEESEQTVEAVPEQIKVASLYDSEVLENMKPAVTAVKFDGAALSAVACRMLLDHLEGKGITKRIRQGHQLVLRESTK